MAVGIAVAVVALAAVSIVTFGAGAVAAGVAAGAIATAGAAGGVAGAVAGGVAALGVVCGAIGTAIGVGAAVAGGIVAGTIIAGTAITMATLGAVQEIRYGVGRMFATKKLEGRNTKCPSGYEIVETDKSRKLT
jgi:hypothetical protein